MSRRSRRAKHRARAHLTGPELREQVLASRARREERRAARAAEAAFVRQQLAAAELCPIELPGQAPLRCSLGAEIERNETLAGALFHALAREYPDGIHAGQYCAVSQLVRPPGPIALRLEDDPEGFVRPELARALRDVVDGLCKGHRRLLVASLDLSVARLLSHTAAVP